MSELFDRTPKKTSPGFTIVELMIATSIFSVILLIATAGIIRIGQLYYKGVTQSKTQNNIRAVSDEIGRSIQFAKGVKTEGPLNTPILNADPVENFCIGDTRYTAYIDKPYKEAGTNTPAANRTGMWAERLQSGSDCSCPTSCVTETSQLLGVNTRVLYLDVNSIGGGTNEGWGVNLKIAYGDNDLLTHYDDNGNLITDGAAQDRYNRRHDATCRAGISGGSFCAVAQLDTVIKKRLN